MTVTALVMTNKPLVMTRCHDYVTDFRALAKSIILKIIQQQLKHHCGFDCNFMYAVTVTIATADSCKLGSHSQGVKSLCKWLNLVVVEMKLA
jgi:hypothetical protein